MFPITARVERKSVTGYRRLQGALSTEKPGALLLLDGYNNLLDTCAFGASITRGVFTGDHGRCPRACAI